MLRYRGGRLEERVVHHWRFIQGDSVEACEVFCGLQEWGWDGLLWLDAKGYAHHCPRRREWPQSCAGRECEAGRSRCGRGMVEVFEDRSGGGTSSRSSQVKSSKLSDAVLRGRARLAGAPSARFGPWAFKRSAREGSTNDLQA